MFPDEIGPTCEAAMGKISLRLVLYKTKDTIKKFLYLI